MVISSPSSSAERWKCKRPRGHYQGSRYKTVLNYIFTKKRLACCSPKILINKRPRGARVYSLWEFLKNSDQSRFNLAEIYRH